MDESQSLDALGNILSELEGKAFDFATHIRLTQSLEGMQEEVKLSALEMMTTFVAAGEDIWLAVIKAKEEMLDLETANGVEELLALYKRAEEDYLCAALTLFCAHVLTANSAIPILKRHVELILARFEHYLEAEKPQELGELFSVEWTRTALAEVVDKGIWHLSQVSGIIFAVLWSRSLHRVTYYGTDFATGNSKSWPPHQRKKGTSF